MHVASEASVTDSFTFLEFIPTSVELELKMNHGQATWTVLVLWQMKKANCSTPHPLKLALCYLRDHPFFYILQTQCSIRAKNFGFSSSGNVCVCVCVFVKERERERF